MFLDENIISIAVEASKGNQFENAFPSIMETEIGKAIG